MKINEERAAEIAKRKSDAIAEAQAAAAPEVVEEPVAEEAAPAPEVKEEAPIGHRYTVLLSFKFTLYICIDNDTPDYCCLLQKSSACMEAEHVFTNKHHAWSKG